MGVGGTLEYLSGLLGGGGGHGHGHGYGNRRRRKQMQTVELKVSMDCEGCERKVKNALSSMKGSASLCSSAPLLRKNRQGMRSCARFIVHLVAAHFDLSNSSTHNRKHACSLKCNNRVS
uniref:HMA domain-containing protein n=1 Tax=Aegilops tauschii subsp. strangulata TaxID=200361 RepID=A0A453B1G9_AEGTS